MARFSGMIGYSVPTETSPGVWDNVPIEKRGYGDTIQSTSKRTDSKDVNDNLTLSMNVSIVSNEYIEKNLRNITYVKLGGIAWSVESATIQRPRVILMIGGVYNGPQA